MTLLSNTLPGAAQPPLIVGVTGPAATGGDPFDSGMWPDHREEFLGNPTDWRNDPAMVVLAPNRPRIRAMCPLSSTRPPWQSRSAASS